MEPVEFRVDLEPDGTVAPMSLDPGRAYRVVVTPAIVQWSRSSRLHCATDSPAPAPILESQESGQTFFACLAGAVKAADDTDGRIAILGHASPVGSGSHNEELAEARAKGVSAWLTGEAAVWVEMMAEHGSPADVQRWLSHWASSLGWAVDPLRTDGVIDTRTQQALEQFQREVSERFAVEVEADGRITRPTLEGVFRVGRHEFERHLADADLTLDQACARVAPEDVFGCGTRFAEDDRLLQRCGSSEAEQQRVDVVVVPATCRWRAEFGPEALLLFTRQELFEDCGETPRAGQLSVRLRDVHGRPLAQTGYTLWVGGEPRAGVTNADGHLIEHDVEGTSLRLELDGGDTVVFDHPYAEALPSRALDPQACIDSAADLDPLPDEALPAPYDDDHDESEDA